MWKRPGGNVHVHGRERSRREEKEGKREMREWEREEEEGGGEERRGREGEREEMRRGEGEEVVHDILSAHGPFYYTCMGSLGPRLSPQKNGERAWDRGYYMGVLACTSSSYTSNSRPPHTAFVACMQVTKAMWGLIHLFLAFLVQVSSAPGILRWESLWAAGRAAGEEVWVWEDADGTWGDREGPQTLSTGAGETEEEGTCR